MERAERIIALCVGLLFPVLLVPILWIMLVLISITAVQRFIKVWKQAAVAPVTAARIEMRRLPTPEPASGADRASPHPACRDGPP